MFEHPKKNYQPNSNHDTLVVPTKLNQNIKLSDFGLRSWILAYQRIGLALQDLGYYPLNWQCVQEGTHLLAASNHGPKNPDHGLVFEKGKIIL